jgi:hypothetical protein
VCSEAHTKLAEEKFTPSSPSRPISAAIASHGQEISVTSVHAAVCDRVHGQEISVKLQTKTKTKSQNSQGLNALRPRGGLP